MKTGKEKPNACFSFFVGKDNDGKNKRTNRKCRNERVSYSGKRSQYSLARISWSPIDD
uniref:Pd57 protein n=1 Tax=Enterococcus faecalis TaxID=1351 RepID=Q47767_ENTFL|nr:pd57 [Enterococcus faecalis] [Enterococcus faecalis OG1X]